MARVRGGKWGFHAAVEDEKARVWLVEKLVPEDPPSILGPSSLVRGAWVEEGVLRQIEEEEEWRWWRAWEEEKTEDGKWAGRGCRSAKMFDWARPYRYRFQRADMADLSVTRWKWGTG